MNNPYEFLGGEDYINVLRTTYAKSGYKCSDGEYVSIAPLANLTGASPFGTGNVLGKSAWNIMGKQQIMLTCCRKAGRKWLIHWILQI